MAIFFHPVTLEAVAYTPYDELRPYEAKLVDSENHLNRIDAAKKHLGINKLVGDPDPRVRAAVADIGYQLDKLYDARSWRIRAAVAAQGYRLDLLVDDPDGNVREAVARRGFGLDKLLHDSDIFVKEAALSCLRKQGMSLRLWIARNPDLCALPENRPPERAANEADTTLEAARKARKSHHKQYRQAAAVKQ